MRPSRSCHNKQLQSEDRVTIASLSRDHSAKTALFESLQCADIGMTLTESFAMTPASSVSSFYLGHPDSAYFNVGPIGEDQLIDMPARRAMDEQALRSLLAPNLA